MLTITKYDMRHVVDHAESPLHYWQIFTELLEVYEPNVDLTLDDMLRPFARKKFNCKIPAETLMRDPEHVRYADYIIPLFYASYVLQCVAYRNVIKDVLVRILTDCGHFQVQKDVMDRHIEMFGDDKHFYWCDLKKLDGKEKLLSDELFQDYLNLKETNK